MIQYWIMLFYSLLLFTPIPVKHTNVIPKNIDHIPFNTKNSGSGAMLYVLWFAGCGLCFVADSWIKRLSGCPTECASSRLISCDEDMDESANAYQAHNDPVDPRSADGEEAPDLDDDEEKRYAFFVCCSGRCYSFSRQLNWTRLLFSLTHGITILTLKLAHTWDKRVRMLTFLSGRTKEKQRQGQGQIPCSTATSVVEGPSTKGERIESENRMPCLRSTRDIGQTIANAQCLPPARRHSSFCDTTTTYHPRPEPVFSLECFF